MSRIQQNTARMLGENIARLRKDLGISQIKLASMLGISQRVLCSYECGSRIMPVVMLPKIAERLNVPTDSLLNVKDSLISLDERTKKAKSLRKLEKVSSLPPEQQKAVFNLIDSLTAAKQTRKAS